MEMSCKSTRRTHGNAFPFCYFVLTVPLKLSICKSSNRTHFEQFAVTSNEFHSEYFSKSFKLKLREFARKVFRVLIENWGKSFSLKDSHRIDWCVQTTNNYSFLEEKMSLLKCILLSVKIKLFFFYEWMFQSIISNVVEFYVTSWKNHNFFFFIIFTIFPYLRWHHKIRISLAATAKM